MVLEGSTSEDAFQPDQLPPSDRDYYDASSASTNDPSKIFIGNDVNANPVVIDLNALPQPFSLVFRRRLSDGLHGAIETSCRVAEDVLKRPVTQQEADALAQIYASSIRTASYGWTLGVVVGAVLAIRGRKEFRFPLWRPMREGSGNSPDKFGPFRGQMARRAWLAAGSGAYLAAGGLLGQIFGGSYALTTSLRDRATDPRLREFNIKLNEVIKKGQMKKVYDNAMSGPRPVDREPGPRGAETWEQAQQRRRVQDLSKRYDQSGRASTTGQSRGAAVDDASPTGGAMQEDFLSDAQVKYRDSESHSLTHDARGLASSSATTSSSGPSSPSGGAWDRLRQGAMSGGQVESRQSPKATREAGFWEPQQTGQDRKAARNMASGATFSEQQNSDQDRMDDRRRAQQEFDARVERERHGST